jgi:S1-C subfamily serine protease
VAPTYNAVIVDDVVPNSPGSQAGIKIGDTIVAVNGIKDLRVWKVSHMLRNAGSKIELTVRREDTVREMVLSLRTPFS